MERYYWIYEDGETRLAKEGEDYKVVTAENIEELKEDFDNMTIDWTNILKVSPLQEGDLIVDDRYVYRPKLRNLLEYDNPMGDLAFGTFEECLNALVDYLPRCEWDKERVMNQIVDLTKLEIDAVKHDDDEEDDEYDDEPF